mmetsp:Transcript_69768/g.138053  ORF Transcript_69768/g.138053 Transcript_69768/m.138053 type:complete len:469 (+) Transcript_69768:136-1542(+)
MPPNERSSLLGQEKCHKGFLGTVEIARLVTFASSFSEGWEVSIFALILVPVTHEFELTTNQLVLLASMPMAAGIAGYLFMGWCMDMVGRKPTIIASYAICFMGCSLMATATNIYALGAGRGVLALGIRSGVMSVSVYMSELSPAGSRGTLVSIEEVYINVGNLCATFAAWILMGSEIITWRAYVSIGACAPALALFCILLLPVPESPRYLQMWGHQAEAEAILRRVLIGKEEEIQRVLLHWKEEEATMMQKTWNDHLEQLKALPGHLGFRLASYCWIARGGSGLVVVGTYFGLLMKGMGHEATLRWYAIGTLGKTLALIPPVWWLIDSYGRRAMFIVSALACGGSMAAAAAMQLSGAGLTAVAICILLYFMSFSLGYGPVVWVYCFEILPHQQRGRAATISMLLGDIGSGMLLISGPYLIELHAVLPYVVLAATNLLAAGFFFSKCPETTGMLLERASHVGTPPHRDV